MHFYMGKNVYNDGDDDDDDNDKWWDKRCWRFPVIVIYDERIRVCEWELWNSKKKWKINRKYEK